MKVTSAMVSGLLGYPVAHSLSPAIHNYLYEQQQLSGEYRLLPVKPEALADFLADLRTSNWQGVNVTVPHKQAVIPYLDELSPAATDCGAVNVIINQAGKLYGDNVDQIGFLKALQKNKISAVGKRILILGAGGAARAVISAFLDLYPQSIKVMARQLSQAEEVVAKFHSRSQIELAAYLWNADHEAEFMAAADIIINTTPVGMWPQVEACPALQKPIFKANQIVIDLIYNPIKTKWLTLAEAYNCTVMNGLDMLLEQAYASFEKINQVSLSSREIPGIEYWETWLNKL